MHVCWPHIVKYKLEVEPGAIARGTAPCHVCGVVDNDWSIKTLYRESTLSLYDGGPLVEDQIAARVAAGDVCCGTCSGVNDFGDPCLCERCACGHCRHDHEKWRWHRLCRYCTPLAYAQEVPNEIDPRSHMPADKEADSKLPAPPHYCDELDKHRPMGQPMVRCKR